jgi:hypothetical protein
MDGDCNQYVWCGRHNNGSRTWIQVIAKLSDGKASHIPYRDSKLTRLLQSSLSGHGRISVVTLPHPTYVDPHSFMMLETLFTFKVSLWIFLCNLIDIFDDVGHFNNLKVEVYEIYVNANKDMIWGFVWITQRVVGRMICYKQQPKLSLPYFRLCGYVSSVDLHNNTSI